MSDPEIVQLKNRMHCLRRQISYCAPNDEKAKVKIETRSIKLTRRVSLRNCDKPSYTLRAPRRQLSGVKLKGNKSISEVEAYKVEWDVQPLGLSLLPNFNGKPTITRIHTKSCLFSTREAKIGDILVAINGECVGNNFTTTITRLMNLDRPMTLHFSRNRTIAKSLILKEIQATSYGVVWKDSQELGVSLTQETSGATVIHELHDNIEASGMAQGVPGDILIKVDGINVEKMPFRQVISLLRHVKKPALLIFKRHPARRQCSNDEYDVVYNGGRIGLVLLSKDGIPVIHDVSDKTTAEGLDCAREGDELLYIGELNAQDIGFEASIEAMKAVRSRTILRFRRAKSKGYVGDGVLLIDLLTSLLI